MMRARHGRDSNSNYHGCKPSTLPLSQPASPACTWQHLLDWLASLNAPRKLCITSSILTSEVTEETQGGDLRVSDSSEEEDQNCLVTRGRGVRTFTT